MRARAATTRTALATPRRSAGKEAAATSVPALTAMASAAPVSSSNVTKIAKNALKRNVLKVSGSCGSSMSENCTYFEDNASTGGACNFQVCKCRENICQVSYIFDLSRLFQR